MHPDPKKIQGIVEMTAPEDKQQLQSFLGMVNYMGTFIPNLSHHTEPLRSMLKQDNVFAWDEVKTWSFQQIKSLILKANKTPLRYYDRLKLVTVQADASLGGLGTCLVQDNQPIAFASKSLTGAESRYANIERELFAIVFACQRFSTYLLGRSFVAESDHKPLEMIAMKNLANAPLCLQRMLLQLQRFDVTIKYRPGPEMQLVDALSCCPARASPEIKLNMRVDYVAFSRSWIEMIKEQLLEDPILATVYQLTQQGWPHERRHVPHVARRYFDFRDKLSIDEGLLLKGPCLVIPNSLKEEYLHRLHEGHLSAEKTKQNAKKHLYWPGMDADISDYKRCQECIKRSRKPKEPLWLSRVIFLSLVFKFPLAAYAAGGISSYETESTSPSHSAGQWSAVLILLVVLCMLSTSAPAAGMSVRKVDVRRLLPLCYTVSGLNSRLVLRCKSGK